MLVVDDHPLLTGGLVGAQVLVNAPVTAPSAENATAATASRKDVQIRHMGREKDAEKSPRTTAAFLSGDVERTKRFSFHCATRSNPITANVAPVVAEGQRSN